MLVSQQSFYPLVPETPQRLRTLKVLIVGGGRIGSKLAEDLSEEGVDVKIVEKDLETCNKLAARIDALVIKGDGASVETLEEVIEDIDVFIAATGEDHTNMMACQLAKLFKVDRIISRVNNPEHKRVFEELGFKELVCPTDLAVEELKNMVLRPKITSLLHTSVGEERIMETKVSNKKVIGKRVAELEIPRNVIIAALFRDHEMVVPRGDTVLNRGDRAIVIGKKGEIEEFANYLAKE